MSPLAQQLVAYAAVLVAAGWLLRRWLRRQGPASCERCSPARSAAPRGRGIRPASLRVLR
ncbi:MAG: hypothetical protein H6712_16440 [Myxococcales bacterium]|nr:hypothetical protein [Myxococcales bacterium]MCB9715459.1 hypothetical protein [Myxococcales bacterium]